MPESSRPTPSSLLSHIDVTPHATPNRRGDSALLVEMVRLMRDVLSAQDRQNELLEELVQHMGAAQKQRANELGQWRQANPHLARSCREAAEAMSQVQTEFLQGLTEEINDNVDCLMDGGFMLSDLVDRYGPRLAHLNGVLQVLSQLSSVPDATNTAS